VSSAHPSLFPYFFEDSVTPEDMELIKTQINLIVKNTCLQFSAKPQENVASHHLRIAVNPTQCNDDDGKMRLSGRVDFHEDDGDGAVLLKSSFTLSDRECGQNGYKVRGAILHLFFLAFGATHIHRRPDRDQFIQINTDCIQKKFLYVC
jgi:hypothetical protein